MNPKFKIGEIVEWKWPPGYVTGEVISCVPATVRMRIKGSLITRHGTTENPTYHLRTRKGVDVLKLESELSSGEMPARVRKEVGGKSSSDK